ncbi:hypothetical protein [Candidatus Nitrotoga sp. 1052]|uniref:hypothetical protein n=1 Tax=Candidatus Nitrotoga sp. 1052 TaxID=2886964 RepID=UPI00403DD62A
MRNRTIEELPGFIALKTISRECISAKFPRPVMRTTTGFHAGQANLRLPKVLRHVFPLQLLSQHFLAVRILAVNL